MPILPPPEPPAPSIAVRVDALIAEMTLDEKVYMMSGHGFLEQLKTSRNRWGGDPYQAGGGCERLGIPAFMFTDGPRGVARGNSTCFPVSMGRGATFDVDLERRIGEIMGIEARAQGCNLSGAVCINLLRHPAWGRAQETYGEDPYLLGEMGAALAQGIQAHNVAATVKHFALNSIENSRFKVDVRVDERTLREVYLPHFKRVLDAGCATVMSAYNRVNGEYCGQNRILLTDILRNEWGFEGFVHSDWLRGVYDVYGASAGLDVENPEPRVFGEKLADAIRAGTVDPTVADTACRRILSTYFRFASAADPLLDYSMELVASAAHRATALEAARKSAVLLCNKAALPLERARLRKVAVLGRLAALANTGDRGSSSVQPPYVVTPLEGLRRAVGPDVEIAHAVETDPDSIRAAIEGSDAVICVVGMTYEDEGEYLTGPFFFRDDDEAVPAPQNRGGGDRDTLRLLGEQEAMIATAAALDPNTIVVIVSGSAVVVEPWAASVGAILQTFYAGMEGGVALAEILLGEISPSGRLPFTVPDDEASLPFFDKDAHRIEYGPLHGYTHFDARGEEPAFPFGFGLSYTRFSYGGLNARRTGEHIETRIAVRNEGAVAADEVVQLYIAFPGRDAPRPVKLLRGFERISLAPGEARIVRFETPLDDLRWWNPATRAWTLEHGSHGVMVGRSSRTSDLLRTDVIL